MEIIERNHLALNAHISGTDIQEFRKTHDRFLCIDDTVYLLGASIKDIVKKWCAFAKLEETTNDLLARM